MAAARTICFVDLFIDRLLVSSMASRGRSPGQRCRSPAGWRVPNMPLPHRLGVWLGRLTPSPTAPRPLVTAAGVLWGHAEGCESTVSITAATGGVNHIPPGTQPAGAGEG